MILSVAMMLEWLSDRHDDPRLLDGALAIQRGVEISFANNIVRPAEFGGKSNTAEITQAVIANIR
jgi:3-isopropylmalate dehydrogenase